MTTVKSQAWKKDGEANFHSPKDQLVCLIGRQISVHIFTDTDSM